MATQDKAKNRMRAWRGDWNKFVREVLQARLDREQQAIIDSVQHNPRTAVASGTARGKDFVSACASLCFMYLTPRFKDGKLIANTKIAMTAPTGRQVTNIMTPEVRRLLRGAIVELPGRSVANDIRTNYDEWFLTGFKADEHNHEAWSGFHAVNTMFVVTEASGISQSVYDAIEGNLQGNSRLLLVFNPNVTTGYAAKAMMSPRFSKFRLDSLNAENVVQKAHVIPGQVDYDWVKDKVDNWCTRISKEDMNEGEGDFVFENGIYRPNDLFRVKVRGMFPKVSDDALIPYEWIEIANKRWEQYQSDGFSPNKSILLGVDVAGMGRDSSVLMPRQGNYVPRIETHQSGGRADHMHVAGLVVQYLKDSKARAFIDTIGEGAGVYARLQELGYRNAISCKYSEGAKNLKDVTGVYSFSNMRAYCYWAMRDWLNPRNNFQPALPPCDELMQEATEVHWSFRSDGSIYIEPKEDIKKRLGRSPDYLDALANTFYPRDAFAVSDEEILRYLP